MIALTVNGKPRTLEAETALPALLAQLNVQERRVAVAVNGEVVPRRLYPETLLRDGDAVEIVRMVGGGSGLEVRSSKLEARPSSLEARTSNSEVVIAGAGIIGCAIAYELSRRGVSCAVLDSRRLGMAATNAAAGILAPLAEFRRPDALVHLGIAGLRRYPAWVERLREDAPDVDVEFALNGVLRVAFDGEELAELTSAARASRDAGLELIELTAADVRELEPRLSERIAGGVLCPDEGQVSNQLFTLALSRAAAKRGARFVEGCPVEGFRRRAGRVVAVRTPQGEFPCERLVLAAGPWTRPLAAKLGVEVPTRPVRGQMLALGGMSTPVRSVVWGRDGYVLPRANGLVFAGATVEEVGFRFGTTQRGLAQVRRAAFALVPQLRQAREHFSWSGLRPGSPDGLPMLGPLPGWPDVTVATGHFRNGILLAPVTAELIAGAIVDGSPAEAIAPFDPGRFA